MLLYHVLCLFFLQKSTWYPAWKGCLAWIWMKPSKKPKSTLSFPRNQCNGSSVKKLMFVWWPFRCFVQLIMKHRHRRNVTSHHSFSVHGLFQLLWILSKDNFYHFFLLSLEVETISLLITFIVRKLLSLYKFYQVLWLINFYHKITFQHYITFYH